ncbi:phage tail tube protein [Zavarzinia sp. CC-PAN008]|uniref:phage tail tube protein n=1 Tax=Zavarzinia sp. CC-PAN008 TaxID=3243332 RepID=UPI003F74528E
MARQRGDLFLLQVNLDGGSGFATVAGLRGTVLSASVQPVDVTAKDSGGFRELLPGAGVQSLTLKGRGVFDSGTAHERVRTLFAARAVVRWRITRGDGSRWTMPAMVTALDYAGDHDGEETFELTVESAGAVSFDRA